MEKGLKARMTAFTWINWSETGREEVLKRDIFDRYVKTRKLTCEDQKYCERIDWHPVDELPLKEEYVKELCKAEKGPHKKISPAELDLILGLR